MLSLLERGVGVRGGMSRRELMRIGGLHLLGLSLPALLQAKSTGSRVTGSQVPGTSTFGRAKNVIYLFLSGGPSQYETFDPKPEAPAEVQGELKSIPSSVPGLDVCELLPRMAQIMDRVTVVRSMTHPYPLHSLAYVTTGIPTYDTTLEVNPRDPRQWPYIGSIVDYCAERRAGRSFSTVPRNIGLPWLLNSRSDIAPLAGPYAAFLGQAHDPFWVDFEGSGTRVVPKIGDSQTKEVRDPFGGILPEGRFVLPASGNLPEGVTVDRLGRLARADGDRLGQMQPVACRVFEELARRPQRQWMGHEVPTARRTRHQAAGAPGAKTRKLVGTRRRRLHPGPQLGQGRVHRFARHHLIDDHRAVAPERFDDLIR